MLDAIQLLQERRIVKYIELQNAERSSLNSGDGEA